MLSGLDSQLCYAGLDVSSKLDLTSLVLLFPDQPEEGRIFLLPFFWVPGENVQARSRKDNVDYQPWIDAGHIFTTEGNAIDEDAIEKHVLECAEKYQIVECAFDRWNAQGLAMRLEKAGVCMVEVPQIMTQLTFGTKAFEEAVAQGVIAHDGSPVMRWQISCAEVETDKNGNKRPVKPKRESGKKIDGVMAAVNAMGRLALRQHSGSVYEERGVMFL